MHPLPPDSPGAARLHSLPGPAPVLTQQHDTGVGSQLLAAALALPALALSASLVATPAAHAETAPERGLISLKVLDYLDGQPGQQRIRVTAPSVLVVAPINGSWSTSGSFVSDTISGASPAYHTSRLSYLKDLRRAADVDLTHYFGAGTATVVANYSTERDYVSRGLALRGTWASDDRNTTWSAGLGYNSDRINPTNRAVRDETKHVTQVLVGVTQVLGTHDIAQVNVGFTRGRGYFTDPYKLFDKRPRERNVSTVLARWNHHFESVDGTLRTNWRYYQDSWSVRSHTLGAEFVQTLPGGWTLTPLLRLYTQSAAEFYVTAEPSDNPFVPNPATQGNFYSGDQRLSGLGAITGGLKVAKQLSKDWSVDVKYERYAQRNSWRAGGSGTPGLAAFDFRSWQFGVSAAF
jgi:hypothetical protein